MDKSGIRRTDNVIRKAVEQLLNEPIKNKKIWNLAVNVALHDIYANKICLGNDAEFKYFAEIMANYIKIMKRLK